MEQCFVPSIMKLIVVRGVEVLRPNAIHFVRATVQADAFSAFAPLSCFQKRNAHLFECRLEKPVGFRSGIIGSLGFNLQDHQRRNAACCRQLVYGQIDKGAGCANLSG